MSRVKKNIAANFAGSIFTALVSLIFLPIYVNLLGVEAYSLVAIHATLLAMFAVFDMGFIQSLSRELARLVTFPDKATEMRDLVRTMEIPYIFIGVLIGCCVLITSAWIANDWVNNQKLTADSIETAIRIIGLIIAIQWPVGFYSGGLSGLQEQVLLNLINSALALLRGITTVFFLWFLEPSIEIFFLVQLAVSVLHLLTVKFSLMLKLPSVRHQPRFRIELIRKIWKFAAGVTGNGLISRILMQMDKILLSRILDLEWFGYYAIANVVSMNLYRLFGPIYSAIYPKLVNLVSVGTKKELSDFYHKSAQSLAVAVFPLAIVLIFFSEEILSIWLQDAKTAGFVAPIASILLVGTLINGILHIPYGLQLAFGWTSLALRFGIISIFIYGILLVILTDLYGVKGGAAAWLIQQAFYLLASIPLMHRRILPDDLFNWYWFDVSFPTLLSVLPVATLWLIMPNFNGILTSLLYIFLAYVFSQLLIIFGLPAMRNKARETYNSLFKSLLGEQK